jgi:hypothetical protein
MCQILFKSNSRYLDCFVERRTKTKSPIKLNFVNKIEILGLSLFLTVMTVNKNTLQWTILIIRPGKRKYLKLGSLIQAILCKQNSPASSAGKNHIGYKYKYFLYIVICIPYFRGKFCVL